MFTGLHRPARLGIALAILLLLPFVAAAQNQPGPSGTLPTLPSQAIAVRCVNTLGTVFESCGGSGAAGTDVNIQGVGGNVVTSSLPVSFSGSLPAGTNLLGKVGIDQTTPGTTNRVDIGVFPDNEPINLAQYGGSATSLGQKTGANSQPVVLASDALPPPDRAATGTIAALSGSVTILSPGSGTVTASITGVGWVASLIFLGVDGSGGFVQIAGVNHATGLVEFGTSVNGAWSLPSAGFSSVLVFATAYTSGNANVALIASPGSNAVLLAKALPVGANLIGKVGLDQTTPGTTNKVSLGADVVHTIVDSGAVTVSDGAGALNVIVDSATLGTVTVSDGAGAMNTIVDSGTLTAVTAITNALPAGTNLIGKVGIDQTTPGTTNRVDIGVFPDNEPLNVAQIGGTATVTGGVNGLLAIAGNVAHDGIDAGNPIKIGCKAETTTPVAVADNDRVDLWCDEFGRPIVRTVFNQTTTDNDVDANLATIAGTATSTGVGASNAGTLRVATLIHDGTDTALVTSDGVLQAAPAVSNIVALSINESAAAPTAAVWYLKREWALPASAHAVPMRAFATVTTAAGSRTMIGVLNSLGTVNLSTNAFAATNSVASPYFYGRLFGCVTTVMSATIDTLTVTYTDELGASSTSAAVAFAASSPVGNCYEFTLGGSDVGARSVTNITDNAAPTGVVTVYGVTSLFESLGTTTTDFTTVDSGELKSTEEVGIMFIQAATTAQQRTAGLTLSLR